MKIILVLSAFLVVLHSLVSPKYFLSATAFSLLIAIYFINLLAIPS